MEQTKKTGRKQNGVPLPPRVTLQNVKLIYRNFSGKKSAYNAEGDRNFSVILEPDIAEELAANGWKIKTKTFEDSGETIHYIKIRVKYGKVPPLVFMVIDGETQNSLTEKTVFALDTATITSSDLTFRPYLWERPDGSSGITAYLVKLYANVVADELDRKYAKLPLAQQSRETSDDGAED